MKDRDKYKRLFEILREFESAGREFSRNDLGSNTGYSSGTIGVYVRNKLKNTFVFDTENKRLIARGLSEIDFPTFFDYMSQKSDRARHQSSLFNTLRDRSLQAFYNAIAIFNNPTMDYRVESFCILLSNAWELLLKARIIEKQGEEQIYRKDKKTISLNRAISLVFLDPNDPVRKNLELLNDVRDHAVHLLLPDIQNTLSRVFQACVFNYLRILHDFEYPNPHFRGASGLLTLVTETSDTEERIIKIKYGEITEKRISDFLTRIRREEKKYRDERYMIPVEYKVVLTKNEKEGDFAISFKDGASSGIIVNVPKDHNKTHPFRSKDVIEQVNKTHAGETKITSYSFQGILLREKIRSSTQNKYYYRIENPLTHKFSPDLVELIIRRLEEVSDYVKKVNEAYKKYLAGKRQVRKKTET